jgi:hypothetical protein
MLYQLSYPGYSYRLAGTAFSVKKKGALALETPARKLMLTFFESLHI